LIAGVLFLADLIAGAAFALLRLSVLGVVGDLMFLEVGVLAILGGLIEFSRSKGVYEFRRITLDSKEEFSATKHLEASKRAVVLFSAALTLFVFLIALALIE
jgi:hypothetical protein